MSKDTHIVRRPVCAASELATVVDQQINSGAHREFGEANSRMQESGADLGEGSAFTDASEIIFKPQSVICGLCEGVAFLSYGGTIDAKACRVSGMCEFEWAKKYPDKYPDVQQGAEAGLIVCSAELTCSALITLAAQGNGGRVPLLQSGRCEIAVRGDAWRERRREALEAEMLVAPEAGIQAFDGMGSNREEEC